MKSRGLRKTVTLFTLLVFLGSLLPCPCFAETGLGSHHKATKNQTGNHDCCGSDDSKDTGVRSLLQNKTTAAALDVKSISEWAQAILAHPFLLRPINLRADCSSLPMISLIFNSRNPPFFLGVVHPLGYLLSNPPLPLLRSYVAGWSDLDPFLRVPL